MHFGSIVLLALFSQAIAQKPSYIAAPVPEGQPKILQIDQNNPPKDGTAVVKTTHGPWATLVPEDKSGYPLIHNDSRVKISDTSPDRPAGYTIAHDKETNLWQHYPPGRVPEKVLPQEAIKRADKAVGADIAEEKEKEMRYKRTLRTGGQR